jgi:hypothetical protein
MSDRESLFDAREMERLLGQIKEAVAERLRLSHLAVEAQKSADDASLWETYCQQAYTEFCESSRKQAQRLPS